MDFEQRGMWFELLLFMRECEQYGKLIHLGKPMSEEMIAKGIGFLPQQNSGKGIGKFLNLLEQYGALKRDSETGVLFSSRLLKDAHVSQVRSEAGRKGAKVTNSSNDFAAAKVSAKVRQNRDNDNDNSSGGCFSSSSTTDKVEKKDLPYAGNTSVTTPPENTQLKLGWKEVNALADEYVKLMAKPHDRPNLSASAFRNLVDEGNDPTIVIQSAKNYLRHCEESCTDPAKRINSVQFLTDGTWKLHMEYLKPKARPTEKDRVLNDVRLIREGRSHGQ